MRRQERAVPGIALLWLCAAVVVAVAYAGRHVDGSGEELVGRDAPVLLMVEWIVVSLLLGATVTRRIERYTRISAGPGLTLTYDLLAMLLAVSWPICVLAFLTRHWLLGGGAALLCLEHVLAVVPVPRRRHRPTWAEQAPSIDLVTANVFVHNRTPAKAARQLVASGADLIVINESTPRFVELFDEAGGLVAYPHRITDPGDTSEYAITVASRLAFEPGSGMRADGPLRSALAVVSLAGERLHIIATHLAASLELGGLAKWREQIEELRRLIPTLDTPLVVVGDMNMTSRRPEFSRVLGLGLRDVVATAGSPRTGSLKITASGPLSWIGPVTRVDYAFTAGDCYPLSAHNLRAQGSDHVPLRLRLAVRPERFTDDTGRKAADNQS